MEARTLLSRRADILRGVDMARWGPYIDLKKLDAALAAIDALGDAGQISPPAELVLEFLRYGGPEDIIAVLIAQDPYPTPGDAQGLCFSVQSGRALPPSLVRVNGCLERAGLRPAHPVVSGDLRPWAVQGVLMMNTALTTRCGERGAHIKDWEKFVDEFLRRLCSLTAKAGRQIHFLLWGGPARAHAALARRHKHVVHEWTHPSPVGDNQQPTDRRFRMCPHFEDINVALAAASRRPIVWDNLASCVAFSDGSCPRNGKPDARASFAAVISGGPFSGGPAGASVIRGEVRPREYAFVDEEAPERGIRATDRVIAPTNNRGEWLGIIFCFFGLLVGRALGRVEVVSDSNNCVNTLTDWLPARRKKGTASQLENFDLVQIAERLFALLQGQAQAVTLTHVRSHQKRPPSSASARERFLWLGNDKADKLADEPLVQKTPTYAVEVLNAPAVLRCFAGAGEDNTNSPVDPLITERIITRVLTSTDPLVKVRALLAKTSEAVAAAQVREAQGGRWSGIDLKGAAQMLEGLVSVLGDSTGDAWLQGNDLEASEKTLEQLLDLVEADARIEPRPPAATAATTLGSGPELEEEDPLDILLPDFDESPEQSGYSDEGRRLDDFKIELDSRARVFAMLKEANLPRLLFATATPIAGEPSPAELLELVGAARAETPDTGEAGK